MCAALALLLAIQPGAPPAAPSPATAPSGCQDTDDGATDAYGDTCAAYEVSWCGEFDDYDFNSMSMCCVCGGGALPELPQPPPAPPSPPHPPPLPPMSPTLVGDARFGCGYEGSHLSQAATTDELLAAVSDSAVTCSDPSGDHCTAEAEKSCRLRLTSRVTGSVAASAGDKQTSSSSVPADTAVASTAMSPKRHCGRPRGPPPKPLP